MRRGAVRGLTVLSCPCLSVGFFQKAISLVQPTHLYSRSLFISSRPQCLLCALFSVSPCLACPQRPLHVVTLCEHRCATHAKSAGSSAIISSPVRSDSVRLPLPSRLVRRTSRLGDKIKIPIDFLRPFSNTPGSVCFPTLSFPLRSAHELPVIVFTLYDIRKACRIVRMPEDGGETFTSRIQIPSIHLDPHVKRVSSSFHSPCRRETYVTPKSLLLLHHSSRWTSAPIILSRTHEYEVTRLGVHLLTS